MAIPWDLQQRQFAKKELSMPHLSLPRVPYTIAIACLLASHAITSYSVAQESALVETKITGAAISVEGQTVQIRLSSDFSGNQIEIPRLAAPLKSLHWKGDSASAIKLQPELQTWKLSWDQRPQGAEVLEMQLDAAPLLMSEVKPIEAAGDGSLFLPAHVAFTSGSKIRYEPQTFKNTVGYWAGMDNSASWKIIIAAPGKFNVAILQGCGGGQGGSVATISLLGPIATESTDPPTTAAIEFEVQETGHFQNFIWRHLGVAEVTEAGEYRLQIAPKHIQRAALMDVRAVHLIRCP